MADVKDRLGLPMRADKGLLEGKKKHTCPRDKMPAIVEAFLHFGVIDEKNRIRTREEDIQKG